MTIDLEHAISQLISMGFGLNRAEAISRLKASDNDLQKAVDAILDPPVTNPLEGQQHQANETWDESQWLADKNNQLEMNGPTYAGQPNYLQPNIFNAPSRPPSRVNSQAMIDLTAEHAAADPGKSLTGAGQHEEQDLQRAMELSLNDLGPQESGVASTRAVHFGPARRQFYEPNKWSLTTQSSTAEIHLDPEPGDRKHVPGEPRCLRPSPTAHYVAPFLTIVHSIPLGREALLCRNHITRNYGQDEEWWSGASVRAPALMRLDDGTSTVVPDELIYETQRLMAFLDVTDRSYGSVEALLRLDFPGTDDDPDNVLGKYLQAWQEAVQHKTHSSDESDVFLSVGAKLEMSTREEFRRQRFSVLDLRVDGGVAEASQTLYEAMDDLIWEGPPTNDDSMAYLERVGDIFTVRLFRTDTRNVARRVDVPALWYPDRYLEASKEVAREMMAKKADVDRSIENIELLRAALTNYQLRDGRTVVDPRTLLESAIQHLTPASKEDGVESGGAHADRLHDDVDHDNQPSLVGELRAVYNSVAEKLRVLDEQKDKARESLKEVSALLTGPSSEPSTHPKHPYTLRGVSTEPHITYVLCPVAEQAENMDVEKTEGQPTEGEPGVEQPPQRPAQYEWWRISTSSSDSSNMTKMASHAISSRARHLSVRKGHLRGISMTRRTKIPRSLWKAKSKRANRPTVSVQKVSEEDVLKAAREEGRAALLVYANERAMDRTLVRPLPGPLRTFIRKDNVAFARELEVAGATEPQLNLTMTRSEDVENIPWGGETPEDSNAANEPTAQPDNGQEQAEPLSERANNNDAEVAHPERV